MADARPAPPPYDCFAIAAPGLEPLVARELAALGVVEPRVVAGGVEFRSDAAGLATAQLWLRTASRVVVRLARFRATAFHELERAARKVEWARILPAGAPFRLRVTCRKSRLYHSDAVAERVAGAIVRAVPGATWEQGAERDEDRDDSADEVPAAAARGPAQLFIVRLDHDRCLLSADASGELLHRRGYRQALARAPLRETLAAALLLAGEWDPAFPLVDPMCGSGTIAIEAALLARRIAPGAQRAFAAEAWPETPTAAWRTARESARAMVLPAAPAPIVASDRDEGAIAAARANAERAGVLADITFRCAPLSALEPPGPRGWLVTNPPYGVRVGDPDALRALYAAFGRLLRERVPEYTVVIVGADAKLVGQTAIAWRVLFASRNGGLPIRALRAR